MDTIERFMAAFEGLQVAHGQTIISGTRRNGKEEAKSRIVREPLTEELVGKHLKGELGVGTIPINERNECHFGVIDVDTYPLDHVALARLCHSLKLPAVVCRSKSGGAHIYFFVEGFVPARDMREKLSEIAVALGVGGSEIFPKQTELLVERGDVGNFINLPYFHADSTVRPAYLHDGTELELEDFLNYVDKQTVKPGKFLGIKLGQEDEILPECPPCINKHLRSGVQPGERNEVATACATYTKLANEETWKQDLEELNQKYFEPPLPAGEIVNLQKQYEKKDYFYKCSVPALAKYCNKSVCRQKKYGIGNSATGFELGGLMVVMSEPRVWFVNVNGKRVELTTEQLQMYVQFQRQCMEQIGTMPPAIKTNDWQVIVNSAMQEMIEIPVTEELTYNGQFKEHLETFCTGRVQAQTVDELMLGKPWTEEGFTHFRLEALMAHLKTKGFTAFTRGQIQERIKELNDGGEYHVRRRFEDSKGTLKQVRVWRVPAFEPEPDIQQPDMGFSEVPF